MDEMGFEEFYESGYLCRLADAITAYEFDEFGPIGTVLAEKSNAYTQAVYDRLEDLGRSYEGLDPEEFTDYEDGYADACYALELNR